MDTEDKNQGQTIVSCSLDFLVPHCQSGVTLLDAGEVQTNTVAAFPLPDESRINREGVVRVDLTPFFLSKDSSSSSAASSMANYNDYSEETIRRVVDQFWKSPEGLQILQAVAREYYLDNDDDDAERLLDGLHVIPTHVTHRTAPPEQISFVHIDYPQTHTLQQLAAEHSKKWSKLSSISSSTSVFPSSLDHLKLVSALTAWICLSPRVLDYPLLVADVQSVPESRRFVYRVGSGANMKHSVGIRPLQQEQSATSNNSLVWYHSLPMKRHEALIFNTCKSPHASGKLHNCVNRNERVNGEDRSMKRESAEVRCLIVSSALP